MKAQSSDQETVQHCEHGLPLFQTCAPCGRIMAGDLELLKREIEDARKQYKQKAQKPMTYDIDAETHQKQTEGRKSVRHALLVISSYIGNTTNDTPDDRRENEKEALKYMENYISERIEIERSSTLTEVEGEQVICAAILDSNNRIFRGHRHHDAIHAMSTRPGTAHVVEEGFITSKNRFVGRREAMDIQIAAGKMAKSNKGLDLFSEDLY